MKLLKLNITTPESWEKPGCLKHALFDLSNCLVSILKRESKYRIYLGPWGEGLSMIVENETVALKILSKIENFLKAHNEHFLELDVTCVDATPDIMADENIAMAQELDIDPKEESADVAEKSEIL